MPKDSQGDLKIQSLKNDIARLQAEIASRTESPALLLTAAAKVAKSTKKPTVRVLAYSGGIMTIRGWGAVAIDLAGLDLAAASKTPLLADHEPGIKGIVGYGAAAVATGKLSIVGSLTPSSEAAQAIVDLVKDGFEFQASVGVEPLTRLYVKPGDTVQVNGQTLTAPGEGLILVQRSKLREVSIVSIGCDDTTAVSIAASHLKGSQSMAKTEDEIRTEERQRITRIEAACKTPHGGWGAQQKRVDELRSQAIDGEVSMDTLQAGLLEIMRAGRTVGPTVQGGKDNRSITPAMLLEAALLTRGHLESVGEKELGAHVMEAARPYRSSSLMDLCRAACQLDQVQAPIDRGELIRAGFSTLSLPIALGNAAHKALLQAYNEKPPTWKSFAAIRPAANFKTQNSIRPSFVGQVEKVAPSGEVKYGTLNEANTTWNVDTYAKNVGITRKDVINDDLGFIDETGPAMGRAATRAVSDLVYATLLGAGAFYAAGNGNYIEGAGTVLSPTSLASAITSMRKQRDAQSNDLDIMPITLLVPPELEITGKAALNSEFVQQTAAGQPTGNAVKSAVGIEVESRLSNTGKFANASAVGWYLFAGPIDVPLIVGFLYGKQVPIFEFFGFDTDPDTLGVTYRIVHDFGSALGDFRASVRSKGAA